MRRGRAGQRAQCQGDRRGQGQQRRAGHAEQQMLDDMNPEDVVVAGHRRPTPGSRPACHPRAARRHDAPEPALSLTVSPPVPRMDGLGRGRCELTDY
jgi:hypothetical protein